MLRALPDAPDRADPTGTDSRGGSYRGTEPAQDGNAIGKLRGKVHRFRDSGIPLVATYHPAYLLRSPLEKRKAWQDLQLAVRTLREQVA